MKENWPGEVLTSFSRYFEVDDVMMFLSKKGEFHVSTIPSSVFPVNFPQGRCE